MRRIAIAVAAAIAAAASLRAGSAPDGRQSAAPAVKASWLMDGGDPQRTSWQRHETIISPATVRDMTLLWTLQTDNEPRQMHNLFPPLLVPDVATAGGPRDIGVLAGVSDNIYGVDLATGRQLWKRRFDSTFTPPANGQGYGPLCPGGLTATPLVVPAGQPGKYRIYAISWDGRLRQLDVATGEDLAPAEPFLPPNGKPYALNIHENVLYTTTAQGCGGNPNQFYSYDLETKKVGSFNPGSGGLWPRLGPSIGKDGRVYAGSGDGDYYPAQQVYGQAIVAAKQNPLTKAMELADWYAPSNAYWLRKRDLDMNVTGPVFDYKGREYTVQSSKECRLWLLDTSALGGEDHRTPVYRTPLVCNEEVQFASAGVWGALATWEEPNGTRWILMPFWGPKHSKFSAPIEHGEVVHGAIAAFRMETAGTEVRLAPAWLSRDMNMADPALVANGVVFGYGSGEDGTQATADIGLAYNTAANRIARSTHAVLYALDAKTGETLWSSGDTITSFNHFTSLSMANGRVYIGTYDGKLYCFGIRP
ncbi:MAG: PQQ-binding-like beta-propeller repeat protein [Acidobacteria bacterium]|nr:PQQ-binding-like beta-propeller repeat protein [Acidobacteriota bacterium]